MPTLDHNKILTIYIPRNACNSIPWKKLNGTTEENPDIHAVRNFVNVKAGTHISQQKNKGYGKFETLLEMKGKLDISLYSPITICRNPFTRTYSLYLKYIQIANIDKSDKPFFNFLETIKYQRPYHPVARNLLHRTQSWFILNETAQIDPSVFVYRFENLDQLKTDLGVDSLQHTTRRKFNDLAEIETFFDEQMLEKLRPCIVKGLFYTDAQMLEQYTAECIQLVKDIYAEDFDNFGYSRNIADAI